MGSSKYNMVTYPNQVIYTLQEWHTNATTAGIYWDKCRTEKQ